MTESVPSGTSIDYKVLQPTPSSVNISTNSTYITFNVSTENSFNLEYYANLSQPSTVYTTNLYEVTVSCRKECVYCHNNDSCIM